MSNLKPCPFCGGEAVRADCVGCGYLQIRCSKCLAIVTVTLADRDSLAAIKKDEERLIANWNRRTEEQPTIEAVLVRCKECKHYGWSYRYDGGMGKSVEVCRRLLFEQEVNWNSFCSFAERRDDNEQTD